MFQFSKLTTAVNSERDHSVILCSSLSLAGWATILWFMWRVFTSLAVCKPLFTLTTMLRSLTLPVYRLHSPESNTVDYITCFVRCSTSSVHNHSLRCTTRLYMYIMSATCNAIIYVYSIVCGFTSSCSQCAIRLYTWLYLPYLCTIMCMWLKYNVIIMNLLMHGSSPGRGQPPKWVFGVCTVLLSSVIIIVTHPLSSVMVVNPHLSVASAIPLFLLGQARSLVLSEGYEGSEGDRHSSGQDLGSLLCHEYIPIM